MELTKREKIAHLYRRLSFGGTLSEIETGEKLGVEATIKRLIDFDALPAYKVHPYEFTWNDKAEADPGAYRFRAWWLLGMASTQRPLEEKLALFWHSHFAVSDVKVEHGPMMIDYLMTIRKYAGGRFIDILKAVSKSPAMMKYLDMDRTLRGHPNENFAREVMELFTMGIGNYSETDVKELSRALTGWGYMDTWWDSGKTNDERIKVLINYKRPPVAFCEMPTMRDDEPKTILGKTADFTGDQALEWLSVQPTTAAFITKKLWEFFAYKNPSAAVIQRLSKVFLTTKGDIKQVMHALVKQPEFWSEDCILKQVKSPVDFVVGTTRQLGLGDYLMTLRPESSTSETRIAKKIQDECGYMSYRCERMGLNLLYPPDVSGWKWGEGWISPATMAERMQYQGQMLWDEKGAPGMAAKNTYAALKKFPVSTPEEICKGLCTVFDLHLRPSSFQSITDLISKQGGPKVLETESNWVGILYASLKMLSGSPDMHVC